MEKLNKVMMTQNEWTRAEEGSAKKKTRILKLALKTSAQIFPKATTGAPGIKHQVMPKNIQFPTLGQSTSALQMIGDWTKMAAQETVLNRVRETRFTE